MKKLINMILLLIVLVSLISFSVNAAPRFIEAGLRPIEDFFSGGWQNYEKTVIFLVFFFLFFSAFLIGAKKAFGGELTRSHKVFAFVAAFMSSLIIVTTMRFDWINLEYAVWFLIGVLMLFGIYALLGKLGMENKKFWAFLLALLITALLLWMIWYLMNEGRPLGRLGRVSDWFGTLGARVGEGFGGEEEEAKSDLWPGGVPPVKKEEAKKDEEKGWSRYWWVILLVVALVAGGGVAGYRFRGAAGGLRRLSLRLMALKRKLRKIINKTLRILRKNPLEITRAERKQVAQNLEKAVGTVDDIINRLEQQESKPQKKQTKQSKQSQNEQIS